MKKKAAGKWQIRNRFGEACAGKEARAWGTWVGEAPGGCQWSDACRVLARRSRGYARPAEWSFFGVLGGYPRSCAPPRLYSQRWLNGGSLRCACSCPLTELPCVLLRWHALCLAGYHALAQMCDCVCIVRVQWGVLCSFMSGREGQLVK